MRKRVCFRFLYFLLKECIMKKRLILMTALFVGSMIVSDGFGAWGSKYRHHSQSNSVVIPHVVERPNNDTQRDVERGVDNPQQLNENKDKVKNEELKEEQQTVVQSDFEGSDVEKMYAASAIPPVELVKVLSQDVAKKEEQKDKMDAAQNGDAVDQLSLKRPESEELSFPDKKKPRKSAPKTPRKSKKAII